MTDRELLEAAAKAAGIELLWTCGGHPTNTPTLFKGLSSDEVWNPLEDDGDALRLAVKLKIDLIHDDAYQGEAWVMAGSLDHSEGVDAEESRPAAMRRAIVRAAAAIGSKR